MHDDFYLPQSSWIALLSIARRYEFQDVFKRAIREIYDGPATKTRKRQRSYSELGDPICLVSIAEQYGVPLRHIVPHLVALVMREEALTEAEVMRLSPLTVSQLGRACEDFYAKPGSLKPLNGPIPTNGPTPINGPGGVLRPRAVQISWRWKLCATFGRRSKNDGLNRMSTGV